MALGRRHTERGAARCKRLVEIGTRGDEEVDAQVVSCLCGLEQRRGAIVLAEVGVGAVVEEKARRGSIAHFAADHELRAPIRGAACGVGVRFGRNQLGRDIQCAWHPQLALRVEARLERHTGHSSRRVGEGGVGISSVIEESLGTGIIVALGGQVEERAAHLPGASKCLHSLHLNALHLRSLVRVQAAGEHLLQLARIAVPDCFHGGICNLRLCSLPLLLRHGTSVSARVGKGWTMRRHLDERSTGRRSAPGGGLAACTTGSTSHRCVQKSALRRKSHCRSGIKFGDASYIF